MGNLVPSKLSRWRQCYNRILLQQWEGDREEGFRVPLHKSNCNTNEIQAN